MLKGLMMDAPLMISSALEYGKVVHADRPIVGRLAAGGPKALLPLARQRGFAPDEAYASRCHLCYSIRRYLHASGAFAQELGPASVYCEARATGGCAYPARDRALDGSADTRGDDHVGIRWLEGVTQALPVHQVSCDLTGVLRCCAGNACVTR